MDASGAHSEAEQIGSKQATNTQTERRETLDHHDFDIETSLPSGEKLPNIHGQVKIQKDTVQDSLGTFLERETRLSVKLREVSEGVLVGSTLKKSQLNHGTKMPLRGGGGSLPYGPQPEDARELQVYLKRFEARQNKKTIRDKARKKKFAQHLVLSNSPRHMDRYKSPRKAVQLELNHYEKNTSARLGKVGQIQQSIFEQRSNSLAPFASQQQASKYIRAVASTIRKPLQSHRVSPSLKKVNSSLSSQDKDREARAASGSRWKLAIAPRPAPGRDKFL